MKYKSNDIEMMRYLAKYMDDDDYTPLFKIRINYKSGIQEEHWFLEFESNTKGEYKWQQLNMTLIKLNPDEIESFYQVDVDFIKKSDLEEFDMVD